MNTEKSRKSKAIITKSPRTSTRCVPGHHGGVLIRKLVKGVKEALSNDFPVVKEQALLPEAWVSLSGGPDSMGLALALAKYGHRIVAKENLRFLYFEHAWRPGEQKKDQAFLKAFSKSLGVPLKSVALDPIKTKPEDGRSWEEASREERKKQYQILQRRYPQAFLLTAHHADDLAETLIWRFFTGSFDTHRKGILARDGKILRPCLKIRKSEIQKFLEEERQESLIDSTNENSRFLRARIRKELIPQLQKIFPKFVDRLQEYSETFTKDCDSQKKETENGSSRPDSEEIIPSLKAAMKLAESTSYIHGRFAIRRGQFKEVERVLSTSRSRNHSWTFYTQAKEAVLFEALREKSGTVRWSYSVKQ